MAFHEFYGKKQGRTYTEIGCDLEGGKRIVFRRLHDREAYDFWHLAVYFREILELRRLLDLPAVPFDAIPRKEKHLFLYLLLATDPRLRKVLELGSALWEMVDGLRVVDRFFREVRDGIPPLDLVRLSYEGVDFSDLLAHAARELHPGLPLPIVPHPEDVCGPVDLMYDRNASSYIFDSSLELAEFVNRAPVAYLNLYLTYGPTFLSTRMGKSLTFFSARDLIESLDRPLFHLFGDKAPGPVEGPPIDQGKPNLSGFYLCCEEPFARSFLDLANRSGVVRDYFRKKEVVLRDARDLFR